MQVATAILSTTAKTEARKKGKKDDEVDKMDVVKEKDDTKEAASGDAGENKEESGKKEAEEGEAEKKETDKKKEPSSTTLANPARHDFFSVFVTNTSPDLFWYRIVPAQKKFVSIKSGSRSACILYQSRPLLSIILTYLLLFRYETVSKHLWGVAMLRDLKPEDEASLVTITVAAAGAAPEEEEPPPPEPFEYHEE